MVALGQTRNSEAVPVLAPRDDASHNAHKIRTACVTIDGSPTHIIVQPYVDRIFILVTQSGKMGTMISASVDVTLAGAESYNVQVLMGKRDVPELELCARSIMSIIKNDGCSKPLLISIALKRHNISTIREVINQVRQMSVW